MGESQLGVEDRDAANAYQMSLAVEPDGRDVIDEATAQVSAWLRARKRWDPRLDGSRFQYQPGKKRDLLTLHRDSSSGREFRMRLTEETRQGIWRTQLTVSVPRSGDPWLALQVANSEGLDPAVPGLATRLLDALTTRDGLSIVSATAWLVTPNNVEEFLERLTDPDRRGLYFVAATAEDPYDFAPFFAQVGRWVREVRGLGQMAVLTPEATEIVAEALGASHAVAPWTLRTFYPDVDPAVRSDGFRHKWLTTERLAKEPDRAIQQVLGRIARRHAALRPPLDGYAAVDRALRRLEDKTLVQSIAAILPDDSVAAPVAPDLVVPGPSRARGTKSTPSTEPVTPRVVAPEVSSESQESHGVEPEPAPSLEIEALRQEAASLLSVVELVKSTFGIVEITSDALDLLAGRVAQGDAVAKNMKLFETQLKEREQREADLESRIAALQESFDDAQIDIRESGDDAARLRDENRYLKQRLAESADFESAYGSIPSEAYTSYPANFDDLLKRRNEFECGGVILTADVQEMLALDEHDTLGNAVHAAWDGFLSLVDYLRARHDGICTTGVREYMRETPTGFRAMPTNKFGGKESRETMRRWGNERRFPVPTEVDANGWAVMEAHFKLAPIGMVSPRMYFLDCYATTGRVYVGYVGAHLTNTMS